MANYKVPQDIEAEDKLIGWLTFKQFLFAIVAAVAGFLVFLTLTKGLWPISLFLLPFVIVPGVLAAPLGRDQPTEIWLASRIRFLIKPRKRIWDQSGIKELVTITVPKREEVIRTDGLSQTEVKSRLEALANTLDSRGWAVKNVAVNLFAQPAYAMQGAGDDRLVSMGDMPTEVPSYSVTAADDILDTVNNPVAQRLSQQVQVTSQRIRSDAVSKMFGGPMPVYSTGVAPAPTITPAEEEALLQHAHAEAERKKLHREHVLHPVGGVPTQAPQATTQTATAQPNPAILGLAQNNDFMVSTIAHQAQVATKSLDDDQEVVVSLR